MVAVYEIAGRKVGSHVLAIWTLGIAAATGFYSTRGGDKKKEQGPPLNAANQDEEKFIKEFIQQANMDQLKDQNTSKH